jgi:spiro-SPASM protein
MDGKVHLCGGNGNPSTPSDRLNSSIFVDNLINTMSNIALINAITLRPPATRPLVEGRSSLERAIDFGRALPGVEETVLFLSTPIEGIDGVHVDRRDSWTTAELLSALKRHGEGRNEIFYFFADSPFLDLEISARMHGNHGKYFADYTYADGYPYGLTPEILRPGMIARLQELAARQEAEKTGEPRQVDVGRETLFEIIKRDINSFDIETEIAPKDQRMLRVSLTADTERNFLLLRRIVDNGGRDAASICRILDEKPGILRTLPAFFPIQIVERCPQSCSYCPYPRFGGDILVKSGVMDVEVFSTIAGKIAAFCGDAVIDVSLWGDPSLHPRIFEIAESALRYPGIDLVIETSGVGWDPAVLSRMATELSRKPTWILSLDAADESVYRGLRGEGFAESRKTAQLIRDLFPESVYVQAVRMKENEEDLEGFFRSWKEKTEKIIIQKYDWFSGFLPDRKVTDLSPLKRFPCWHLTRDFPILIDGSVPLCREDVEGRHLLGNILTGDPASIWREGEEFHRRHVVGDYPRICAGCDEWYTFNF